jgi:hypothetical protein
VREQQLVNIVIILARARAGRATSACDADWYVQRAGWSVHGADGDVCGVA